MRTDTIIKHEGFHALAERLDPVEMERFIMLINREKFDYTKWRQTLFEDLTVEELSRKAMKYQRKIK